MHFPENLNSNENTNTLNPKHFEAHVNINCYIGQSFLLLLILITLK